MDFVKALNFPETAPRSSATAGSGWKQPGALFDPILQNQLNEKTHTMDNHNPEEILFAYAEIVARGELTAADMNDINVANVVAKFVEKGKSQQDAAKVLGKSDKTVSEMVVRGREAQVRLLEKLKRIELSYEELRKLEKMNPKTKITLSRLQNYLRCSMERVNEIVQYLEGEGAAVRHGGRKPTVEFLGPLRTKAMTTQEKAAARAQAAKAMFGRPDRLSWDEAKYNNVIGGELTERRAREFRKFLRRTATTKNPAPGGADVIADAVDLVAKACEKSGAVQRANAGVVGFFMPVKNPKEWDIQQLVDFAMSRPFDPEIYFFRSTRFFSPEKARGFFNAELPSLQKKVFNPKMREKLDGSRNGEATRHYVFILLGGFSGDWSKEG